MADDNEMILKTVGKMPRRSPLHQTQGRMPSLGWKPENRWRGFWGYEVNPTIISSPGDIFGNTNNKITNEKLITFTKEHVLEQMKNYGNVNMPDKEINGIVTNILKNKKEAEKMTNELVLIEMVQYFKNQMKIQRKTVTLDEFIKLANNQK